MGSVVSVGSAHRYMGGKVLPKFFKEDTWPALADLFMRLGMNITQGFEIFKAFAKTDINEDGLVDLDECFRYIGGRRTKFTERIFFSESYYDEDGLKRSGLTFKNFMVAVWSYCSLTKEGVARYVFEIFDPDQNDLLGKEDLIAMFKMLYASDDYEQEYIEPYKLDGELKILKSDFCKVSAKYPYLIRPALEYQQKVRSRTGGSKLWDYLTKYRSKELQRFDLQQPTLDLAVDAIVVASKNFSTKHLPMSSNAKLQHNQSKIEMDREIAEREYKLLQRRMESESRSAKANAPDRRMHQAWAILAAHKNAFEEEEYTFADLERRYRDRSKLFELFDIAKQESIAYYEYKDEYDMKITEGTDADHEARYQDYIKTEEGAAMLRIFSLIKLCELVLDEMNEKISKMKRKPKQKPERQALFESQLKDLTKIIDQINDENITKEERNRRIRSLIDRDFTEEESFAKKHCKRSLIESGHEKAHKYLCETLKAKTIGDKRAEILAAQEQRRRDYIMKEFEIITNYGSRTTKWEYVLNKEENRPYYVNRLTKERKHFKTAICEKCDGIFVQHEMRCDGCNGLRSAKNLKLFRPLGFKDITLE